MCGITGFFDVSHQRSTSELKSIVKKMSDTLAHRGPDDAGVWVDEKTGVALGHQRLSIIDLSPQGHQPMVSPNGRYVIVYNGEIYNHNELRKELELLVYSELLTPNSTLIKWRGHSDTETLLAGFETWGIEETLKKTVGMFALALWDHEERTLTLARDRIGEKPLYYGFQSDTFVFGSELKALKAYPEFVGEIDRDVICLYLRYCYIPAPYSIYKGIRKLLPGTYIQFAIARGINELRSAMPKAYWSLSEVAAKGIEQPFSGNDADAISVLEEQLKQAIGLQMMADVPLGAFLSGGVDSSTIVALMQAQSPRPIRTFSIGFDAAGYNEAEYAKAIAKHLVTDHTEHYVSSAEAMQVIPLLGQMYDEPFADSSQIPTFLVSQIARKHVAVSLSGDAGDELFGGYNRYSLGDNIWNKMKSIPRPFRSLAARTITSISPQKIDRFTKAFSYIMPAELKAGRAGDKLHKLAKVLDNDSPEALYRELISHWKNPASVVINSHEPETVITDVAQWESLPGFTQRMMYIDSMSYLPDDILVKVDRAAMANSLETRVPFLDHRTIELAWSLPLSMKIRNGQTKWLLRQVLYKYVPKELIERPKMGFGLPIGAWLRGPLRDWAESLLEEKRLAAEGFFNPQPIRKKWFEHLSGERNWQYQLWTVLMFQAWLEKE